MIVCHQLTGLGPPAPACAGGGRKGSVGCADGNRPEGEPCVTCLNNCNLLPQRLDCFAGFAVSQ